MQTAFVIDVGVWSACNAITKGTKVHARTEAEPLNQVAEIAPEATKRSLSPSGNARRLQTGMFQVAAIRTYSLTLPCPADAKAGRREGGGHSRIVYEHETDQFETMRQDTQEVKARTQRFFSLPSTKRISSRRVVKTSFVGVSLLFGLCTQR